MRNVIFLAVLLSACEEPTEFEAPAEFAEKAAINTETGAADFVAYAKEADGVFVGRVTQITYAMSQPDAVGAQLPFTFVTYSVEKALLGTKAGNSVTLRFFGGPLDDGALFTSEYPNLDVGDRDIVFVQGNDTYGVPWVLANESRVRLSGDGAYTSAGHAITLRNNQAYIGDFYDIPETRSMMVGPERFDLERSLVDLPTNPTIPAKESVFVTWLQAEIQRAGLSRPADAIKSSDPAKPIFFSSQF